MAPLVERFPSRCPHGHRLGIRRMLVGWDNQCDPPQRIWVCLRCNTVMHRHDYSWPE
ncbi:hypothetical protein LX13_002901 [Williamsia maris]|uniref:Uncharacterized protein n=1 Tax=Williamsia maris TaxID=72806 RepID=A0ABT1HFQ9_9NOCA|nr:hypothetical protein [Williamsia maris]